MQTEGGVQAEGSMHGEGGMQAEGDMHGEGGMQAESGMHGEGEGGMHGEGEGIWPSERPPPYLLDPCVCAVGQLATPTLTLRQPSR